MIIVTKEQIEEARRWERMLYEGRCSLNDALFQCMASGAPISSNMLRQYESAITSYNKGQCTDLAESFGIAQTQSQKKVILKYLKRLKLKDLVDYYHELDYPLSRPIKGSDQMTAFDKVAIDLNLNAEYVVKEYYSTKK